MKEFDSICPPIVKAGVPLVVIDQRVAKYDAACVISGNLRGGTAAGNYLTTAIGHGGRIVHIQAEEFLENARLRRDSFLTEVKRQGCTVVKTIHAESDRKKAYEQMKTFLKEGTPFQGLFAENDAMALGAVQALKEINYSPWPTIVGFDGVQEALDAIRHGTMAASVAQDPVSLGKTAFELALKIIQKKPYDKLTTIMPNLVTRQSLT